MGSSVKETSKELFFITCIKNKGFDIEKLIKLSDEELDKVSLPFTIIEFIKHKKNSSVNVLKPDTLKEIIGEEQLHQESTLNEDEINVISQAYSTESEGVINEREEIIKKITEEQTKVVVHKSQEVIDYNHPDIKAVQEALSKRNVRSYSRLLELLKKDVPMDLLKDVGHETLSTLINQRIADIKKNKDKS